ncbi:hypothetical protein [Micromonospora sp. DH14]|uniref:hypothetical protein n=1 Tax=Micromonospora sp. DH14 TaxID=3040120 RepID=UPI0024434ECC|nr:hypothetical protein [Micromonospora sp. DH14]MDG9675552.1 hypothetical protein [Micromonospora sp. DH14]
MAMAVTGLSSLGNLLLSIAVARSETIAGVGQFAIAFSLYVLTTGLARAVVTDSVLAVGRLESIGRGSTRASAVGVAVGLVVAFAGVLIRSPYLTIVGVLLPGLVLYDYNKVVNLGLARPRVALVQEVFWTTLTSVAVMLNLLHVVPSVAVFGIWAGAGALIGYSVAVLQKYPVVPSWGLARSETKVAMGFGGQFLVTSGSAQLASSMLAATAGTAVVGALSAGRTILGPITLLSGAASSLMIPYLARTRTAQPQVRLRAALRLTLLVGGLTLPLALLLPLIPDSVGRSVLAGNWSSAQPLLLALALEGLLQAPALIGFAGHRIQQAGGRALLLGSVMGLLRVLLVVTGGVILGAPGAAYAMVVMALISTGVWWASYVSLLRRDGSRRALELI